MSINLNQLSKEIYENNVEKGFYEDEKNISEVLCLIHSEVSEALECDRENKYCMHSITADLELLISEPDDTLFKEYFEKEFKDTFEDKLADIMIRVMDLAGFKGIDMEAHIEAKMIYNSLRQYKHGKKY